MDTWPCPWWAFGLELALPRPCAHLLCSLARPCTHTCPRSVARTGSGSPCRRGRLWPTPRAARDGEGRLELGVLTAAQPSPVSRSHSCPLLSQRFSSLPRPPCFLLCWCPELFCNKMQVQTPSPHPPPQNQELHKMVALWFSEAASGFQRVV